MNRFALYMPWLPASIALLICACAHTGPQRITETTPLAQAKQFIAEYETQFMALDKAAALASWEAQLSGKDVAYKASVEAQNKIDAALSDPGRFALLKSLREQLQAAGANADPLVARQIDVIYLSYLGKQVDPELLKQINAKQSTIEQAFNVYRPHVDNQDLSDSQVLKILKESHDSAYRQKVWEASKGVGSVVAPGLKELVGLRNQSARKLGFHDYYEMELELGEMNKAQVLKLLDQLYELMREPFAAAKGEMDTKLAKWFNIPAAELRPWHYSNLFFQEPPPIYDIDLDPIFAKQDVIKLAGDFYASIGLPIDDVIAHSDLFERPGKYPHAQCMDIDKVGDIRVMANVVPNEEWMATMLHELGHAVYDKYIPRSVPYVLRDPAHTLTTEGLAMMFERFSKQPAWMKAMGLKVDDPATVARVGAQLNRDRVLVFAAWTQVIVRFELAMYENPDQNLNTLWWDLAEKYQLLHRPEGRDAPDYAAKIHVISAPAYYHSYIMGEMFAAQLFHQVSREALKTNDPAPTYNGRKEIGKFLKAKVFGPGNTRRWDVMVRESTGQELSPKTLIEDLKAAAK